MKKSPLLAVLALATLRAPGLVAHPMGNFSVNRYARLEPSAKRFAIRYIVDFAEIPTFQELSTFPALAARRDPPALEEEPDARLLADRLAGAWRRNLTLTDRGAPLRLQLRSASLRFSPGAGGLPTMKLTLALEAPWSGRGAADVVYADTNFPDRIGWREVVLRPGAGIRIVASDVETQDRSRELTSYPADPTAEIPQRTVAAFRATRFPVAAAPGPSRALAVPSPDDPKAPVLAVSLPASEPPTERSTEDGRPSARARSDRFTNLVSTGRLTAGVVALSLLVAFCLGGLHALSPGHGKTVVAAYLVGSRGTARHALLLGAVVTASHTIGVFLLGIVTLALSNAIVPEKLYPAIQFLSGLTIVAIGGSLSIRRWRRRFARHDPGHSHAVDVPETAPTASALLALGVSGGILPCPSALVVLLSAIALHRIGFGLVLIVAFSAGLAAVLSAIGLLVVRAGRFLARFENAGVWARRLPAFSALLIGLLGAAIALRALPDLHHAFFLR